MAVSHHNASSSTTTYEDEGQHLLSDDPASCLRGYQHSIRPTVFPSSTTFPWKTRMSNTTTSSAAWLTAAKTRAFKVKPAPMWKPAGNEILVRNRAVALNLIDHSLQSSAVFPLDYPSILSHDLAGEVVEVGSSVTRFKPGDRVLGQAVGISTKNKAENAFQHFTILQEHMASPIPSSISYDSAAVMPLGLSTAACGLFQNTPFLQLDYPTSPARAPNGKTILIWGGSSSVGSNAIQLAVAAGYEVFATASPRNFGYVRALGASQVFDYSRPSITSDLVESLRGKRLAGILDCIGGEANAICIEVMHKVAGKGAIATTKSPSIRAEEVPKGVTVQRIFGTSLKDNAVGRAVYVNFLPKALEEGNFVPNPASFIMGEGLERVQDAIDVMGGGFSARKAVVKL